MPLKYYFPISVAVFVLVLATVHHFSVPVIPFAVVLLVGETILGFQVEDHKVPRILKDLVGAFRSNCKIRHL